MSRENMEVVRKLLADIRDPAALTACMAADCEFRPPTRGRITSGPAVYYGPQDWLEYIAEIDELLDGVVYEADEVFAAPDGRVVAYLRARGSGQASGAPFEQQFAHVCEVRNGQVVNVRLVLDRAEALAAVGLSE